MSYPLELSGVAGMITVGGALNRCAAQGGLVASVEELLEKARRLDLSSTEGRFRLGEIVEALRRQLPAAADLHDRLAIDLEVDRDTITEAWFVASAFPPATRHPPVRPAVDHLPDPTVPSRAPRAGRPRRIGGLGSDPDPAGAVGSLYRPPPQPAGPVRIGWAGRPTGTAVQQRIPGPWAGVLLPAVADRCHHETVLVPQLILGAR
jgi:hypothetical protein